MDVNVYELERVADQYLAERRATAARHAALAALARREAGPGLRVRIGRAIVRLGRLVEGPRPTARGAARAG